ncbi:ATP-dependent DNA helicase RecG [Nitrospirillum pindoramense]|uniref:ATP-dependent DNA helicase RecG n=1 Tax=Nitrospirillum amazonense TaxID=28077 RepID=A0A560HG56_9PROT|nr:ATP-dependent DNA helicase RecG [Nitrospirillum amazonense]
MLDAETLLALFRNLEADNVERTSTATDKSKIGRAICAFANDLADRRQPGVLFIGQKDDGSCAGLDITDEILKNLSAFRSDGNIQPLPQLSVDRKILDGCTVAVVEVQPSDNPPVKFDGRVCIRVGPRRGFATAEEERRLTEKRRWGALPFDQHGASGASIDDLNLLTFREEILPSMVAPEVLEENHRQQDDQMRALRLLTPNGTPTNGAVLLLGKDPRQWLPGAYMQFVRIAGTNLTDPIRDQKEVSGTLASQIRQIEEIISAHIAVALDPTAARSTPSPDYPIVALREFVRNALIHRNYEGTAAPVRLHWYDDRIEILSPGGPYGMVTIETFGQPGATDYRNPMIAEAAKSMGFVHRFGSGIARAREALKTNGNPAPQFIVQPAHILAIVRPKA